MIINRFKRHDNFLRAKGQIFFKKNGFFFLLLKNDKVIRLSDH